MASDHMGRKTSFESTPGNSVQPSDAKRRLVAVAFVDIVGYTILMASDEARTHERWMTILAKVIRPRAAVHHGTMVKSTGDGVLMEFPSVLDALEWAREVQHMVSPVQTESGDREPTIALRIAVHFCDVIATDFDI